MAKGKSSATSATRKKHARKAVSGAPEEVVFPKEKKPKSKEKGSKKNKEPRKKVYIPPVKPAPVQPDPLDILGIAQRIPPELLVVLRRLAKKDSITKRRALEELQANWLEKARTDNVVVQALVEVLPVWFHHVPSLFLHPSRRIRLLAVGLHASLLSCPSPIPDQLLFFLQEVADADQAEYILGSWRMAAHDVDRQVSAYARQSWDRFLSVSLAPSVSPKPADEAYIESAKQLKLLLDAASFARIVGFIQRVLLDPGGVYLYVNPPQPAPQLPTVQRGKGGKSAQPVRKDAEPVSRAKPDEEEEKVDDRNARLRIGAFGAAEWILTTYSQSLRDEKEISKFLSLFDNAALWTSLYYGEMAPFVPEIVAFGWNQPGVRRSAWSFLQTLLRTFKSHLEPLLPAISTAVLRSAWVEPDVSTRNAMWAPLLTFLKEHPNAWDLELSSNSEGDEDEENEDSEGENDTPKPQATTSTSPVSHAFQEFLGFLELGCSGSPLQGYPAIIIILSTISPAIFATVQEPLQTLFISFWAAVDGRALSGLDRVAASSAFLSSLLESAVFMVRRLGNGQFAQVLAHDDPKIAARVLVEEQISRVWEEVSSGRLKVQDETASRTLAKTLLSLKQVDDYYFAAAWDKLAALIRAELKTPGPSIPSLVPSSLKIFREELKAGPNVNGLINEIVHSAISQLEQVLEQDSKTPAQPERLTSLIAILDTFGEELFQDSELAKAVDEAILQHISLILSLSLPLILVYLSNRKDEALMQNVWHTALQAIAESDSLVNSLSPLLDAAEKNALPASLKPSGDELDGAVGQLVARCLTNDSQTPATELSVLKRLLIHPGHFISKKCYDGLISSLGETFSAHSQNALHDEGIPLSTFSTPLKLLQTVSSTELSMSLLPDIFLFAFVVPEFREIDPSQEPTAEELWSSWNSQASEDNKHDVRAIVKQHLRDLLLDCTALATPLHLLHVLSSRRDELNVGDFEEIFPSKKELDAMLDILPPNPVDVSLAVIDPLVPTAIEDDNDNEVSEAVVDRSGYSSYARVVTALLHYFSDERQLAKENVWALRHFLAFAQYADEKLQFPEAESSLFGRAVSPTALQDLTAKVDQITAYVLSSVPDESWFSPIISSLLNGQPPSSGIGRLLYDLVYDSAGRDTVRESRVLHSVLQHILTSATKAEADQMIMLARKIENKAPHAALAIILSITQSALEPPRLDRYRNELAAGLLGIPASKANVEGLWSLRRLFATAPDPESDIVFLSTPRAVNLMRACQQWITSDEDIAEAVESEMTLIFIHLAPILQNIPGSHWDFIFDVLENNLENCSFDDSSTLATLSRSLRLLLTIQDLASTNKSLRTLWQGRQNTILTLVRDLVATKPGTTTSSGPLSVCRELALTIVQNLPSALIDQDTLPKMCHLVTDSSVNVQIMAYHMLREAATKRTEYVVVEAAVDTEIEFKAELPLELIDLLQRSLVQEEESQDHHNIMASLLSWMLTFDLFDNASLKVKSGYIDHLRQLDLISGHFLPEVFSILGLYEGAAKAFKLDIWAVDEFYLDLYSSQSATSLSLLAAHLYYPAVTTYTSTYFSPALIRAELVHVKDTSAAADLTDENLTVKVASAVNEVTASYAVDEYQLELKLKLPVDWPLHNIEVKDTARVGVTEDRWRAWILGVQQILSFRSGSIIDGISFFKKNVTSHFEGQSECAICYSVISAMDGSLPKKPCKTCKNRFHAGCLYKWFSSSHSPTCPLCRSEIM
ncbi:unnamed protein product [Somion occarium]|uniref:E3 ubiquitin-protein ligase listerin n=1 Tax=Somion occarium TaxID=3059160 RepID=A0ABP1DNB1_9APHY